MPASTSSWRLGDANGAVVNSRDLQPNKLTGAKDMAGKTRKFAAAEIIITTRCTTQQQCLRLQQERLPMVQRLCTQSGVVACDSSGRTHHLFVAVEDGDLAIGVNVDDD
jgi:hypothetical protein